jgi:hypothetical protein
MAIIDDQIKFYKSIYVNDSLTNGGRIGTTLMIDDSLNNLFRNVQSAERATGIDLYRKFFIKNENPNDLSLENPKFRIANVSSGESYFEITDGTDQDNQSAADDYTDWYGSGYLHANINSGESSFSVDCKKPSGYPSGSLLKISHGIQQAEVLMIGSPSWNGNLATINISGEVGFNFLKDVTVVSAILPLANLTPSFSNWMETSVGGSYDETTYPIILYNIGAITESWTLTFTSSTTFSVSGAIVGDIGSGSITNSFIPVNESSYYFNLNKDGWIGSWLSGDTITFNTVHAAKSVWAKESVPVGAGSQGNDLCQFKLTGESA